MCRKIFGQTERATDCISTDVATIDTATALARLLKQGNLDARLRQHYRTVDYMRYDGHAYPPDDVSSTTAEFMIKHAGHEPNTVDERIFDIVPNTTFFNAEVKEWHI